MTAMADVLPITAFRYLCLCS